MFYVYSVLIKSPGLKTQEELILFILEPSGSAVCRANNKFKSDLGKMSEQMRPQWRPIAIYVVKMVLLGAIGGDELKQLWYWCIEGKEGRKQHPKECQVRKRVRDGESDSHSSERGSFFAGGEGRRRRVLDRKSPRSESVRTDSVILTFISNEQSKCLPDDCQLLNADRNSSIWYFFPPLPSRILHLFPTSRWCYPTDSHKLKKCSPPLLSWRPCPKRWAWWPPRWGWGSCRRRW